MVGQRDRGHAAERHADDGLRVGRQRPDRHRDVLGVGLATPTMPFAAAVGVAVAGEIERDQRAAERHRHGVPGVRVLRTAVQEDELGIGVAPDQRAQATARLHLHRLAPDGGRAVVGKPELLGVLVEHRELVVRDPFHSCSLSAH